MIRTGRLFALLLFIACLAMDVSGLVSLVLPGNEQIPDRPSFIDVLIISVIFITFPGVGLAIAWMRPANPVGWLFLVVGIAISLAIVATEYAGRVAFTGASLPGPEIVAWAGGWSWYVAVGIALPLAVMLFPDGRLPGPRWRPVVGVAIGVAVVLIVAQAIQPGPLESYGGAFQNPFGVSGPLADALAAFLPLGSLALVAMAAAAVISLVVRFRRSRSLERQQIKWLLYPAAIFVAGLALAAATSDTAAWSLALLGLSGFPIGVGIGILRHRLFDIDLVIRRTLIYGALVAILGAVYVGLVLALQSVLSGFIGGETLPVAISTLVIAAMFGPVRARVQRMVDRRFYRSRYDARQTLERFAGQLRDQVEVDAVGRSLVDVAAQAVRPASAGVWVRGGPAR